ncbi:PulJ/GspJ family protein [Chromohalobacter israelensis]|uniref:PulJ/GspJ family protein n=1 Tax=Chromohalobacter israelensis TaxID=141390 RepID=UPI0009FE609F|nr:prepilin-type N-terminal cleavage/methylation domain-containing protein [Chromohalobacter israelensis]MDF9435251.1 prepilin-type N-terminal cleavage/methylation domain-containing protein [Chromohalobacter israelensis]
MNNRQRQRGFTLIEMMISLLLGLIILGGTITAYQAISSVREQRDALYQLQDELMYIHRALASSVKVAESISIEADDNGNKLSLTSSSAVKGNGLSKIKCPGAEKSSQGSVGPVSYHTDGAELLCQPGGGAKSKKIVNLSSGNVAGIESIQFCRLSSTGKDTKECEAGQSPRGIIVVINYYDHGCEECSSKSVSFHLAKRDLTSALGVGK